MAKFRIKLKLQGLDLEVEGTREDLPVMREALTQQFAGMMLPATDIAGGESTLPHPPLNGSTAAAIAEKAARPKRKGRPATSGGATDAKAAPVDWVHDTAKYGSPLQKWTNADKAIWLLYVAGKAANVTEMSGPVIVATFAKHFRQAVPIRGKNLSRDLGKLKSGQNGKLPLVSEDTTKTPPAWFLTDAGNTHAQTLVSEARGQGTSA